MGARAATILTALCAVLALATSTAAAGLSNLLPEPLQVKYNASFSPKSLSKTKRTPIVVRTSVRFWKEDGSQVPALKELHLRFDRRLRLDLGEVPACSLAGRGRPEPARTCQDAVVARGTMKVDTRFPEADPILQTAKAILFKSDASKGGPMLFLWTRFTAPITAVIVTSVEVKPVDGSRYGLEMVATVPKIAGGAGSVTRLGLRFRHGMFDATCSRGGSLFAGFTAHFAEGTVLGGAASRFCN